MPSWSHNDEEMYEAIKASLLERESAEEIAARTVNKRRRLEGRTPNKTTMGTGNPYRRLEARTRAEVYNIAKKLEIRGRSGMSKIKLIEAIRKTRS